MSTLKAKKKGKKEEEKLDIGTHKYYLPLKTGARCMEWRVYGACFAATALNPNVSCWRGTGELAIVQLQQWTCTMASHETFERIRSQRSEHTPVSQVYALWTSPASSHMPPYRIYNKNAIKSITNFESKCMYDNGLEYRLESGTRELIIKFKC